jgi:hypothetical protein
MNPLSCLLCRWIAARCLDDGRSPAGWTAGHLSGCAGCRACYERERGIAARLMLKSNEAEFPLFLHDRILANLDSREAPPASGIRRAGWAYAICGAAALLVVGLQLRNEQGGNSTAGAPLIQNGSNGFASLPGKAVLALDASLDGPLEGEMQDVMDDARTALHALSKNFLPAGLGSVPR